MHHFFFSEGEIDGLGVRCRERVAPERVQMYVCVQYVVGVLLMFSVFCGCCCCSRWETARVNLIRSPSVEYTTVLHSTFFFSHTVTT